MNTFKVGPTKYVGKGELNLFRYTVDKSVCITVYDPIDGGPMYRATVLLDTPPAPNCVWLKGWNENEGVPEAFVKAGLGTLTGRVCATGFVEAQEFKLNDELIETINKMRE